MSWRLLILLVACATLTHRLVNAGGEALQPEEQKVARTRGISVGYSGGGIRAAIGSIAALRYLKESKRNGKPIFDIVGRIAGISGGTWGMLLQYGNGFDYTRILDRINDQCLYDRDFGNFKYFYQKTCGSFTHCHTEWTNELVRIFSDISGFPPTMKMSEFYAKVEKDVEEKNIPLPLLSVTEWKCASNPLGDVKMECLGADCAITKTLNCGNGEKNWDDLENVKGSKLTMWDAFSYSSAAWSLVGLTDRGAKPMEIKDGILLTDSGGGCNIPLHLMKGHGPHTIFMFDYSDNHKAAHKYAHEFHKCAKRHVKEKLEPKYLCGTVRKNIVSFTVTKQECAEDFGNLIVLYINYVEYLVVFFPMRGMEYDVMTNFPTVNNWSGGHVAQINYFKDCFQIEKVVDNLFEWYMVADRIVELDVAKKDWSGTYHKNELLNYQ